MTVRLTRRRFVAGALAGSALLAAGRAEAQGDLVEAARKEGQVNYLSAGDLVLVQKISAAFEAKYPGIKVQGERIGAERIFQRLDQEYARDIHNVDVVDSSDAAHFLVWKRQGWLARHVPDDVARFWPDSERDPDGMYATFRASMAIMGR
ncbi:MAG: iron ABC transporter substrate-binding protein, partial [Alphaproteobacteria bacterium]